MKRAVALFATISMLGCFPHNEGKRTIAKFVEGGTLLTGIVMEAVINTGADCDAMTQIGAPPDSNCHQRQTILGNVGVALILGGLLGFVATVSTAEDDKEGPRVDIKADKAADSETKDVKLPPGVKPADAKPDAAKPDAAKPDTAKPDTAKGDAAAVPTTGPAAH